MRRFVVLALFAAVVAAAEPIDLLALKPPRGPAVRLALSGGGARGLASIGVLRAFDRAGIDVSSVAGVSMGAVVGALYAAGYPPDSIATLVDTLDWDVVLSNEPPSGARLWGQREDRGPLVSLRFRNGRPALPTGLISGQRLADVLSDLLGPASYRAGDDFSRLGVCFASVATDLSSGESVVYSRGDLPTVVRGSASVPLVLEPTDYDGRLLVDGGMLEPIPTRTAGGLDGDVLVAVDVTSDLVPRSRIDDPVDLVNQATTILQLDEKKRMLARADVVIHPDLGDISNMDFRSVDELIALGEESAERAVADVRALLDAKGLRPAPPPPEPHLVVDDVEFIGAALIDADTLLARAGLHRGWNGSKWALSTACARVVDPYREDDYPLAVVRSATFDGGKLSIALDEGRIASIRVEGVRRTKPWVVRRLLDLRVGDPYRLRDVRRGRSAIEGTGLFSVVSVMPVRGRDGVDVVVSVVEKPYAYIGAGWRYTDDGGHDILLEAGDDNVLGIAYRGRARAVFGPRRWHFGLRHGAERLWKSYLTSIIDVYAEGREHTLYSVQGDGTVWTERRAGASVSLGENIGYYGRVSATGKHEWAAVKMTDAHEERFTRDELTLDYSYSALDRDAYPRMGTRQTITVRLADGDVAGDLSYTLFDLTSRLYMSLGPFTLEPSVKLGLSSGPVPFVEQFTVGGRTTLMGAAEEEFRGDNAVAARLGLRVEMSEKWFAFVRYDAADVWTHTEELTVHGTHWGLGSGLGWSSPVGPAEIAVGVLDGRRGRVHAQVGWAF